MMNIVHIIPSLNIGGAENTLVKLVDSKTQNNKITHSIITLIEVGKMGGELSDKGIAVHTLSLHSAFDLPRGIVRLIRLIWKTKPDVVHTWMYHANLIGGLTAKILRFKNIVWAIRTTDSVGLKASKASRLVRKLNAILSSWLPSHIIYVAEAAKINHEANGFKNTNSTVIPNGFDTQYLSPVSQDEKVKIREQYGISKNQIVIGTVGRFNIEKDHKTFVTACGLLLKNHINIKILLVGRNLDSNNKILLDWINTSEYPEHFILCGEQKNVIPYYSMMDIFCLHSRNEGFPNVLGEAMSMSLPCVTTDVGDAGMLVGELGIVIPKEDPRLLATGLEKMIIKNKSERNLIGQALRKRIISQYSLDNTIQQYEEIYIGITS